VQIGSSVVRFRDTCNVYLIRAGTEAILIDFGDGAILDHLSEFGVERVTDVLMTHHHRDNAQGLARAAAAGIRIWVPPTERDLFENVGQHWQSRAIDVMYDLREDRFSLLEDCRSAGWSRSTERDGTARSTSWRCRHPATPPDRRAT